MAKKAKKRIPKVRVRERRSRLEQEKRLEKLLYWGVGVVVVLLVGVLGYGLVYEKIVKPRRPVAVVNGVPITVAEFQGRVRYERLLLQLQLERLQKEREYVARAAPESEFYLQQIDSSIESLRFSLLSVGDQFFEQLIEEELVRQEVKSRNITVSSEGLQQEIELLFGRNPVVPTPVPSAPTPITPTEALTSTPTTVPLPTPTVMSEEVFLQEYNSRLQILKTLGVSEQMYRSWVEVEMLTVELQAQMAPVSAEQVQVRILFVDSEEQANELAARLDAGEDFAALKEELEADEEFTGYARDAEWYVWETLEQYFGIELVAQAFNVMEKGEHSQPIFSQDGSYYIIIELMDRGEHELGEGIRQQRAREAFREWLNGQQDGIERRAYASFIPK